MKYEVRKACNVFMYGNFVDLVWIELPEVVPEPPKHWCSGVDCVECWNRGETYTDWRDAKRSESV